MKFQTDESLKYSGTEALVATEKYLKNYNSDLILKFSKALKSKNNILEFGAGIGTLAVLWNEKTGKKPDCLEVDPDQCEILRQRGFETYLTFEALTKKHDGIYTSNVLEHIEDDLEALRQLHKVLKPEGVLVIYVPAFQCLFSRMDEELGHYRRYGKKELLSKLSQAGYEIKYVYYSDSLGFFASLLLKYFESFRGSTGEVGKSFQIYDSYIYPISKFLDLIGFKYLFGKNLFVVVEKS